MKVHYTLIFFFLTLQEGTTGLIDADIGVYKGTEGGNITVECSFTFSGLRIMFCKEECKEGNILVETDSDRNQSGRYSIEYKDDGILSSSFVYVTITQLKKSDSGLYMCRLKRPVLVPDSRDTVEIRVTDASTTSKPDLITWLPSASTARTTTTPTTQSGRSSTPSSASPTSSKQSETPSAASQPLLIMSLILVLLIITLSVAVLIFCRKRYGQPKEHHEKTVHDDVTGVSQVYEEVREEDRQHRSPVEVSTVYAQANYSKSNRTEEDSGELNYSEVNFSTRAASSLSSAPSGKTDTVLYSTPQEAVGSANHSSDGSSPLYSTVASH